MKKLTAVFGIVATILMVSCTAVRPVPPPQSSRLPDTKLYMPKIFADHMVLQRNKPIRIWGWSSPSAEITAVINEIKTSCKATKSGTWLLELPPMKAGGPYTLTVSDGRKKLIYNDILVGEVWICSGQSNMEMPLKGFGKNAAEKNAAEEIAHADYPEIRLITVRKRPDTSPQYDIPGGDWGPCTPKTAAPFSATAYFFGKKLRKELNVPIGLILSAWGGTPCQAWCSYDAIKDFPHYKKFIDSRRKAKNGKAGPWVPTALYNGMIQPLIPLSIAGFIWYQGEANRNGSKEYVKLFPAMIADWRAKFLQGDLPFFYCQIAPFRYREKDAGVKMREAQREALYSLPNLGIVVLNDKATLNNIHPPYKKAAGERLAAWALNKVYGKNIPYSGPLFRGFKVCNGEMTVSFDYSDGLNGSAGAFEIAGEDGIFHKAEGRIADGKVILKSSAVKYPISVRYAWGNTATGGLFNKAGLPASSFTTAEWKDAPAKK